MANQRADYLETAENPASESNTDGTWIDYLHAQTLPGHKVPM